MARRYSVPMHARQSLPLLWLLSDARNDAGLEQALERLPQGSGFVFRHYHLDPTARCARYSTLCAKARARRHLVILSRADWETVAAWDADGLYGSPEHLPGDPPPGKLWLATAHDSEEMQQALALGASGIFLSPVFPSASHPGGETLGVFGFRVLAQQSPVPVIALGGMDEARARELDWPRWGAIDGLASTKVA